MYPSGYKASKLYSINPVDGSGDLSFARSSTGTRVNDSGIVETIAIDTPRIDYTGGGCGKLLIEPQSTNSLIYSEQFDNSYWGKTGVSIIANDTIAPDGTMTADRATNLFTGQKNIQKSITSGAGSFSIYAKKGVGDTITLITLGPTVSSTFDLQNVTASGVGVIQEIGNGWYRCSIPITGTTQVRIYPPPVLNDYVYLWGAQLEGVTAATSYTPTSGTTVTRTQDTSLTTSSNIAAAINSEEGVLFVDFDRLGLDYEDSWIGLYKGSNSFSNSIRIIYRKDRILAYFRNGSGYQAIMTYYSTFTMPRIKVAFKWKVNDFAIWANGVEGATDTSGTTFNAGEIDTVNLGDYINSPNPKFNSKINALAVYDTALSDADLTTLTTL